MEYKNIKKLSEGSQCDINQKVGVISAINLTSYKIHE